MPHAFPVLRISETVSNEDLKRFCEDVEDMYGKTNRRESNFTQQKGALKQLENQFKDFRIAFTNCFIFKPFVVDYVTIYYISAYKISYIDSNKSVKFEKNEQLLY